MNKVVALGSDHVGFALKKELTDFLKDKYEILDTGPLTYDAADDYPDFAEAGAKAVASGKAWRGILICGSGVGVSITANKVPGIRACLCHDTFSARQGVEHVNMNVLCLGAHIIGTLWAKELVTAFLNADYPGVEKHQRRLNKLMAVEKRSLQGGQI